MTGSCGWSVGRRHQWNWQATSRRRGTRSSRPAPPPRRTPATPATQLPEIYLVPPRAAPPQHQSTNPSQETYSPTVIFLLRRFRLLPLKVYAEAEAEARRDKGSQDCRPVWENVAHVVGSALRPLLGLPGIPSRPLGSRTHDAALTTPAVRWGSHTALPQRSGGPSLTC